MKYKRDATKGKVQEIRKFQIARRIVRRSEIPFLKLESWKIKRGFSDDEYLRRFQTICK